MLEVKELSFIPGAPPDLVNPPSGCPFHPRCPVVMEKCSKEVPPFFEVEAGHRSACCNRRSAAAAALAGTSIAMGLSFALAGLNLLRGPSLLPSGGALLESLVFALAGGTGGWLVAAMAAKAR